MQQHARPPSVMTIAGSDSGGGAGIQADLRTFAAYGLHGTSAITALTAQNTRGVTAVHGCPAAVVRAQMDALFDDFSIAAVKIGMLASVALIDAVADAIAARPPLPLVLDPVMVASSGARLLDEDAAGALRERLFPLATLVTPNLPEAAALLGVATIERDGMAEAAEALLRRGAAAVLLKGGHLPDGDIVDRLQWPGGAVAFQHRRLPLEGHGTGCTLSSAIACGLALGRSLEAACRDACDYVHGALAGATRPGSAPLAVLDHFWRLRRTGI